MRIKTRLKLSTYLYLCILTIIVPILVWAFIESGKALKKDHLANEIKNLGFERVYLRDEYLMYKKEHTRVLWHAKTDKTSLLLQQASIQFKDEIDRKLLNEMKSYIDDSVEIFSNIEKLWVKQAARESSNNQTIELPNRLFRQLQLNAYALNETSSRLSESAQARADSTFSRTIIFTFIVIIVMALATILNSVVITTLLNKRLAALTKGARIISKGNLEYRIEHEGSDELADLTETINGMTGHLRELYTALENEIAQGKQSSAEIQELNEHLEQYTRQLESANAELEAFSYSVSHDLRAPLRHITGFVQMLDKRNTTALDEKSRHYMSVISESAQKMGNLIDDLLSFSRMGRAEMMKTRINMVQLVGDVSKELQSEGKGADIEIDIGPLPEVYGDFAMLRQVLINLISNSIKFSQGKNPIHIEINGRDDNTTELIFYVRDNGVGFDMKYVNKLFGVFQRLHSPEDFDGTGIGLANVRRIIHRHGGRTWAEGVVNAGATFYFSLPITQEGPGNECQTEENPVG